MRPKKAFSQSNESAGSSADLSPSTPNSACYAVAARDSATRCASACARSFAAFPLAYIIPTAESLKLAAIAASALTAIGRTPRLSAAAAPLFAPRRVPYRRPPHQLMPRSHGSLSLVRHPTSQQRRRPSLSSANITIALLQAMHGLMPGHLSQTQ